MRSNIDLIFFSLMKFGQSEGEHQGSSLLENLYILKCMDSYLLSTNLSSMRNARLCNSFLCDPFVAVASAHNLSSPTAL